jgi:hypothetical protein
MHILSVQDGWGNEVGRIGKRSIVYGEAPAIEVYLPLPYATRITRHGGNKMAHCISYLNMSYITLPCLCLAFALPYQLWVYLIHVSA